MCREIISMDNGWKFHFGDIVSVRNRWAWGKSGSWNQGPESKKFDDSTWQDIDVPHDFVITTTPEAYMEKEFGSDNVILAMEDVNNIHTTAGSFKKDVGWYRKHFFIPKFDDGRKIYFVFDGIYRDSSVYLNDFFVGGERSGYKKLVYDISDFINYGGDNIISVKADARQAEGWFYEGGGIYRHTYILKTEQEHIESTFVYTDVDLERGSAEIHVKSEIVNCTNSQITTTIFDDSNTAIAQQKTTVDGESTIVSFYIDNINLWDTHSPYLYKAVTQMYIGGEKKDEYTVRFGVRDIKFDADIGFILNGKHTKIKGACCHQNHGGLGSAIPDDVYRYRIECLKGMGCNAYRASHYPPTPELLDVCDELGILVMDETRLLSSERGDLEQLECMVKRDRNHPCVIMYSLGNEEAQSQTTQQGAKMARTMIESVKKLDPYTPTTMGLVMWDLKNKVPINDIDEISGISKQLDIAGFNYHHSKWRAYHAEFPNQPMICTEQGTFKSTRGCYETDALKCHLAITDKSSESYMKGVEQWKACLPDWMSGLFIWTGFDYYGEPTPYAWPAISSQFGVMDICGYPKDSYYYYKSWWSEEDVLHIFPHWNWNVGDIKDVYVFSNCDEVELFVNGNSLGKKTMIQNEYLVWENTKYELGELMGIGYKNGNEVMREVIKTTGVPDSIRLVKDYLGDEIKIIRAEIIDENGDVVPNACCEIVFEVDGGKILGTSNGDPSDNAEPNGNVRKTFNGLAQVIVKTNGAASVSAYCGDVDGCKINIEI